MNHLFVTLEFPFAYNDYINPHFRPLKPHLRIWALEMSEEELEWKFERVCEKCEDWNPIQEFFFLFLRDFSPLPGIYLQCASNQSKFWHPNQKLSTSQHQSVS